MSKDSKIQMSKDSKIQNYKADSPDRPAGERWVSMTNALARAGHGLSLAEKRLVVAAASKLDSRRAPNPFQPPKTKITAQEYAETFGVSLDTAYDQLQSAGKQLFERKITFYEPPAVKERKRAKPAKHVMRWVGEATYHDGEGWIELHWWPALLPHLMGLRDTFTKYQLEQASALRSASSWRLLELLSSWQDKGRATFKIDEFATAMEATEKQRADFAAIRRKLIEPAVKELIEKDGWLIEWDPIKTGRKVTGVAFVFRRNPQQSLL